MSERKQLTMEQASEMLPNRASIHTFVTPAPGVLIGCDWDRSVVLKSLQDFKPELSGEIATGMNHGICFHDGRRWVFVETKQEK